ncbi:MAG: type IV toxin-antitoxin system AbiEi family antitoxin [Gammaproteobacteria bacterium]|nr:type IV toxin-antitoxin system AbiEi family antitoxin [Gammaproteobacteria bacterium]
MEKLSPKLRAAEVIDEFAASGRYHFTAEQMRSMTGGSSAAARTALTRLAKKGMIASPARGFYVIVPPEYRRLGCLPADQFIPALMEKSGRIYYAALLSAAEYHGAAHHRPQVFQVALAKNRRPISCGTVRVSFVARKNISEVPVREINTPRGSIQVSSIEATALDLVGYAHRVGGLDHVATIFCELAGDISPELLVAAARTAPITWAQRLGHLLEVVGAVDKALPLKDYIRQRAQGTVLLVPGLPKGRARRAKDWRLYVNAEIEVDL